MTINFSNPCGYSSNINSNYPKFNTPVLNFTSQMPIMSQSTANVDTFDKEFEEKEKAKEVKNIAKTFISTIAAAGAILGGLVVAKRTGVVKDVQNPTKAWDKVQSKLAKAGGNIETQTINWYNRIKNTVTKTQKNEKTYETLNKLDSITS